MEKNCFLLKIDNEVTGNYKKLNCVTFEVIDGSELIVTSKNNATFTLTAEGCTFTQPYYQIVDATEYTYTTSNYQRVNFIIKGNGKIVVNNKYNLGQIVASVRNIDFSEFVTYGKDINFVDLRFTKSVGSLNTIFENCSKDLKWFSIYGNLSYSLVEGDLLKLTEFKELNTLRCVYIANTININNFKDLLNLKLISLYYSPHICGNVEQLALDLYNNGKTSGTIRFELEHTDTKALIVPDIITNRALFYCTFSENGYTFSQSKPNT